MKHLTQISMRRLEGPDKTYVSRRAWFLNYR